jgi:hypothetical protein
MTLLHGVKSLVNYVNHNLLTNDAQDVGEFQAGRANGSKCWTCKNSDEMGYNFMPHYIVIAPDVTVPSH